MRRTHWWWQFASVLVMVKMQLFQVKSLFKCFLMNMVEYTRVNPFSSLRCTVENYLSSVHIHDSTYLQRKREIKINITLATFIKANLKAFKDGTVSNITS